MMETTNQTRSRIEQYDQLAGMNVREVKSNNIVLLSLDTASSNVGSGDTELASTTTDSDHNLFLVEYSFSSTTSEGVGCITVGNSTHGQVMLGTTSKNIGASQRKDSPLLRVPASTSVGLHFNADTAGTVTGYAVFVKEPTAANIETE